MNLILYISIYKGYISYKRVYNSYIWYLCSGHGGTIQFELVIKKNVSERIFLDENIQIEQVNIEKDLS